MTQPSPWRWLLAVLALWLGGCASATDYGDQVRYAPAFRSYVLAIYDGSDDPLASAHVLVNPVSGEKLRCKEDVHRWLGVHQDAARDAAHDANVGTAAGVMYGAAAPALAAAPSVAVMASTPAGALLVGGLLAIEVGLLIEMIGLSDGGQVHFEEARLLFEQRRWAEAAARYELAILKDGSLVGSSLALYELGVAYAQMGRADDAAEALHAFVTRALVRDVKAYRNAERWLAWLDAPMDRCESQAPIDVRW
jgi:tetratricopeptide (TPR) repeat protein